MELRFTCSFYLVFSYCQLLAFKDDRLLMQLEVGTLFYELWASTGILFLHS